MSYIVDIMNDLATLVQTGSYAIDYNVETSFTNYKELKDLGTATVVIFPADLAAQRLTRAGTNQYDIKIFLAVLKKISAKPGTDAIKTEIGALFDFMLEMVGVIQGHSLDCGAAYKNVDIEQFFDYEYLNQNRAFSGVLAANYLMSG